MDLPSRDPSLRTAVLGLALVAPTAYFIGAAVLKYALGIGFFFGPIDALAASPEQWRIFNLLSPFLFMGGSLLALTLNLIQIVRVSGGADAGGFSGTVTVLRKPWNLAVAALCLLALFVLTGYLVAENWQCWVGLRTHC